MLMRAMSKGQCLGRGARLRALGVAALALTVLIAGLEGRVAAAPPGNFEPPSGSLSATLLLDGTPPSAPEVAVTGIGPTHVSLAWSSIDDGQFLWYTVYQNGIPIYPLIGVESATAYLLRPGGTYTFTVRALDFSGNSSPLSEPVTVTTPRRGAGDTVPPTTPSLLIPDVFDNEISLRWRASTDNHDPPTLISYEVSLNGEVVDLAVGGRTTSIVYGVNGINLVSVVAIDSSGNRAAALSVVIAVEF